MRINKKDTSEFYSRLPQLVFWDDWDEEECIVDIDNLINDGVPLTQDDREMELIAFITPDPL